MYSFGELFATYLSAETLKIFGELKINLCELNDESRSLNLKLSGDTYIPFSKMNNLREEIKHALRLDSVSAEISFS